MKEFDIWDVGYYQTRMATLDAIGESRCFTWIDAMSWASAHIFRNQTWN